jgi:hypothetical protein
MRIEIAPNRRRLKKTAAKHQRPTETAVTPERSIETAVMLQSPIKTGMLFHSPLETASTLQNPIETAVNLPPGMETASQGDGVWTGLRNYTGAGTGSGRERGPQQQRGKPSNRRFDTRLCNPIHEANARLFVWELTGCCCNGSGTSECPTDDISSSRAIGACTITKAHRSSQQEANQMCYTHHHGFLLNLETVRTASKYGLIVRPHITGTTTRLAGAICGTFRDWRSTSVGGFRYRNVIGTTALFHDHADRVKLLNLGPIDECSYGVRTVSRAS